MAQVVGWDGDYRLLLFTRSAAPFQGRPLVNYGRILDLRRLVVYPELYLDSLTTRGPWWPLDDPIPADRLLAMARVQPLR